MAPPLILSKENPSPFSLVQVAATRSALLGHASRTTFHQIAVLKRSGPRRRCLRLSDRLCWLLLARWWPGWRTAL